MNCLTAFLRSSVRCPDAPLVSACFRNDQPLRGGVDDSDNLPVQCRVRLTYGAAAQQALARAQALTAIVNEGVDGGGRNGAQEIEGRAVVAVGITDGVELLLSQLSVLLASFVYVPFDPRDPRCADMVKQSGAVLALVDSECDTLSKARRAGTLSCLVLGTESLISKEQKLDLGQNIDVDQISKAASQLELSSLGTDVSHVFFTSGSTGEPKGVVVRHSSLSAFVYGKTAVSSIVGCSDPTSCTASRVFLASALTFDPHLGDTLATLSVGAMLIVAPKELLAGGHLMECLRVSRATHVCLTPTVWGLRGGLAGHSLSSCQDDAQTENLLPHLQELSLGGEPMPLAIASAAMYFSKLRVVNTYGVTEATVYQAAYCINAHTSNTCKPEITKLIGPAFPACSIGLRYSDGRFSWIDKKGEEAEPCPDGSQRKAKRSKSCVDDVDSVEFVCEHVSEPLNSEEGEIVIRGPQVGAGYLGRDLLTAKRFVTDSAGLTIFRTGDLGKPFWVPIDRNQARRIQLGDFFAGKQACAQRRCACGKFSGPFIQWVGRADTQIKHRGVRIEVEEIEATLHTCKPFVERAVVVKDSASENLVAYIATEKKDRGLAFESQDPNYNNTFRVVAVPPSTATALRMLCMEKLPSIMVPSKFFLVSSFASATSLNGKLDRRMLAATAPTPISSNKGDSAAICSAQASDDIQADYELSATEHVIAAAWAERLGISARSIAPWDSFRNLGGDSLDAQRVAQGFIKRVCALNQHSTIANKYKHDSENFGELQGGLEPAHMLEAASLKVYASHLENQPIGALLQTCAIGNIQSASRASSQASTVAKESSDSANMMQSDEASRALYSCSAAGDIDGLRILLDPSLLGLSPDAGSTRKKLTKTPLHIAAANGQISSVRVLLEYGANVFATSADKVPPAHVAAGFAGDEAADMLELLFNAMRSRNVKAPTAVRDGRRQTLVHASARGGSARALRYVLSELAKDFATDNTTRLNYINCIDRWNRTSLHWAVVNNNPECVQELLAAGANPSPNLRVGLQSKGTHLPYESPIGLARRKGYTVTLDILQAAIDKQALKL